MFWGFCVLSAILPCGVTMKTPPLCFVFLTKSKFLLCYLGGKGKGQCQVPASAQPPSTVTIYNCLTLSITAYCIPSHSPKEEIAF